MLSPGQLYTRFKEEFAAKRPKGCGSCQVPLAYAVTPPDDVSANWRIGIARDCPHKCELVIAEIYMELAARYDLLDYLRDESEA